MAAYWQRPQRQPPRTKTWLRRIIIDTQFSWIRTQPYPEADYMLQSSIFMPVPPVWHFNRLHQSLLLCPNQCPSKSQILKTLMDENKILYISLLCHYHHHHLQCIIMCANYKHHTSLCHASKSRQLDQMNKIYCIIKWNIIYAHGILTTQTAVQDKVVKSELRWNQTWLDSTQLPVLTVWQQVRPCWYNTKAWKTGRQTDKQADRHFSTSKWCSVKMI